MNAFDDVIAGDRRFFKKNKNRNYRVRFARRCELEHALLALSENNQQIAAGCLGRVFVAAVKQIAPGCRVRVFIPFDTGWRRCNPEKELLDDLDESRARRLFEAFSPEALISQ